MKMEQSDFLKRLGLYIKPGFLDREFCHELCGQISRGPQLQSPLPETEIGEQVVRDNTHRPMVTIDHTNEYIRRVEDRLKSFRPDLESYFDETLQNCEFPHVNTYKKGDFINMHMDFSESKGVDLEKQRKISVVVYLNEVGDASGEENTFEGGELTFYGLVEDDVFGRMGYPVKGETGKLIAYRATTLHGVNEIIAGTRHTLSSGFY